MLNCHDATFLLSQKRERRLGFSERMKLLLHTGMCSGCRRFGHQIDNLGKAARSYAHSADEPSG